MIILKAFQGLENFYIKFQDFPYFSRICTNAVLQTALQQVNDNQWLHSLVNLCRQGDDHRYWQTKIDRRLNELAMAMRRHLNKHPLTSVLKGIGNLRYQVIFDWHRQTRGVDLVCGGSGVISWGWNCGNAVSHKQRYFVITTAATQCRGFTTRASWAAGGASIFRFSIRQTVECVHLTQKQVSHIRSLVYNDY